MGNNVLFKTSLLKGPQGDRGEAGVVDAVPVDGVLAYDGNTIPEGYEETEEPQALADLVETVEDLEEAVTQNTDDISSLNTTVASHTSSITSLNSGVNRNAADILTQTARIDQIANLPSGSTSGDAELQDIRVGYNGTTYGDAGTAVRNCDQVLQDQFSGTSYTKTGGSGNKTFSVYIPKGTKWSYTNNGSNSQTLVATYSDNTTATLRGDLPAGSTYNGVAAKTIIKVGGWYNASANFTITIYGISERLTDTQAEVATLSGQVSTATSDITEAKGDIETLEGYYYTVPTTRNLLKPSTVQANKTLSTSGAVVSGSHYVTDYIEVESGITYYMSQNGSAFLLDRICLYDESKSFISKSDYANHLTIPSSGKYVRIESWADMSNASNKYQFEENGVTAYVAFAERTVISKDVLTFVSPEMFGAIGDGEANDTTAIQQCFNYAVSNNLPVMFSKRTYKITSSITVPTNLYLDGNGATISAKGYFAAFNLTDCVVTIKNLKFVGLGNMSATDNKAIKGAFFFSTFENIWIESFYRGIDLTGADIDHSLVENKLINITVYDCYQGIKLADNDGHARGTDGTLKNVNIRCNNSEYGLQINAGSGWKVDNIHVYGEVATAIFIVNAYACDISNIYIEYFTDHGLFINTQGNVNVNNMSIFIDEQNSDCIYVEKSGWTTTSNVVVNLANIDVWVKASDSCYFLRGTNCYVNLVNYSKRGNVSNITDNGLNSADYVKVAQYATL